MSASSSCLPSVLRAPLRNSWYDFHTVCIPNYESKREERQSLAVRFSTKYFRTYRPNALEARSTGLNIYSVCFLRRRNMAIRDCPIPPVSGKKAVKRGFVTISNSERSFRCHCKSHLAAGGKYSSANPHWWKFKGTTKRFVPKRISPFWSLVQPFSKTLLSSHHDQVRGRHEVFRQATRHQYQSRRLHQNSLQICISRSFRC